MNIMDVRVQPEGSILKSNRVQSTSSSSKTQVKRSCTG